WEELERRGLSPVEADRIVAGLTNKLKLESPAGLAEPMSWMEGAIGKLIQDGLVGGQSAAKLVQAIQGEIRMNPLPRLRENTPNLHASGEWRYAWSRSI